MIRGYAFGLLPFILATFCVAGVHGAAPTWTSSLCAQAPPTQSAPSTQAPPIHETPSSVQSSTASPGPVPHTISVTFDYDFDRTPACAAKIKHRCVKQFIIYDISSGSNHAYPIGTVALPDHPYGQRQGIAGKTDPHVFESGKHLIAIAAQEEEPQPRPLESNTAACTSCTAWVNIP